jgi:hypothetical protein
LEANDGRRCAVAKAGDGEDQAERANSDSGNLHEKCTGTLNDKVIALLLLRYSDQSQILQKNQGISL